MISDDFAKLPGSPFRVTKDEVQYDYKRLVVDILQCDTCQTVFMTHVPTGFGVVLTSDPKSEFCLGCVEVMNSLDVREQNGSLPS